MTEPLDDARMTRGRALYLAVYEWQGARWEANDHKELWCEKADRYLELAGQRCDAVNAGLPPDWKQDQAETSRLPRKALVPPPSEAGREEIARINDVTATIRNEWGSVLCYRDPVDGMRDCGSRRGCRCKDIASAIMSDFSIRALSPDPGTVAVASAQYRCTCGAEPYCAPNVHAASCPLAISSTHHRTPAGEN